MIMCPDPLEFLANYGTAFGMLNADLYNGYDTWHRHFGDNRMINPRTNSTCTNATTGSGYPLTSVCEGAALPALAVCCSTEKVCRSLWVEHSSVC